MHNLTENPDISGSNMEGADTTIEEKNFKNELEVASSVGNNVEQLPKISPEQMDAMVKQFEADRNRRFEEDHKKDATEVAALRAQLNSDKNKAVSFNLKDLGLSDYVNSADAKTAKTEEPEKNESNATT